MPQPPHIILLKQFVRGLSEEKNTDVKGSYEPADHNTADTHFMHGSRKLATQRSPSTAPQSVDQWTSTKPTRPKLSDRPSDTWELHRLGFSEPILQNTQQRHDCMYYKLSVRDSDVHLFINVCVHTQPAERSEGEGGRRRDADDI